MMSVSSRLSTQRVCDLTGLNEAPTGLYDWCLFASRFDDENKSRALPVAMQNDAACRS